jgi:hypothetical protein
MLFALGWLATSACGRIAFDPLPASDAGSGSASACALPSPWDSGASYPHVLYVAPAPTGSDTNDGSAGAPFATITGAQAALTAGTQIIVAPGTYPPASLDTLAGTMAQPILITAQPGAIIDGVDSTVSGLYIAGSTFVVVDGLRLENVDHGVYIDGSTVGGTTGAIIRNVTVESAAADGIKVFWVDNVYVEDNTVLSAPHVGIDLLGCHGGTVARNQLAGTRWNIEALDGTTNFLIQGNQLGLAGQAALFVGGQDASYVRGNAIYQTTGIQVVANVLQAGVNAAITLDDALDTTITHNTFVSPSNELLEFTHDNVTQTTGPSMVTFSDNLISFSTVALAKIAVIDTVADTATFTLRRNLWWATDDPSFAGPVLPAPLVETSSIVGLDPQLTPDGHLAATSPAIGTGDPAPGLTDLDGNCFAAASTPGADEP